MQAYIFTYTYTFLNLPTDLKEITRTNLYLLRSTKSKPSKSQKKALSYIISPDYSRGGRGRLT